MKVLPISKPLPRRGRQDSAQLETMAGSQANSAGYQCEHHHYLGTKDLDRDSLLGGEGIGSTPSVWEKLKSPFYLLKPAHLLSKVGFWLLL